MKNDVMCSNIGSKPNGSRSSATASSGRLVAAGASSTLEEVRKVELQLMVTGSERRGRRAVETDRVIEVQIEHRQIDARAKAGDSLVDRDVVFLGSDLEGGPTVYVNDDLRVEMIHVPGVEEQLEVGVLVGDVSHMERELEGVYLSIVSAEVRVRALEIPSVEGEEGFDERLVPPKSRAKADLPKPN